MITSAYQKQKNAAIESLYEVMQVCMIEGYSYFQAQNNLEKLAAAINIHDSVLQVNHDRTDSETQVTLLLSGLPFILINLESPAAQDCFFSLTPPSHEHDLIQQITLLKDITQTVRTLFEPGSSSHGP